MNKREVAQILAILKEYYPRDFVNSDLQTKVEAWYLILQDYDYKLTQNAVISFVSSDLNGFMPSVGQIVDKINKLTNKNQLTENEAWDLVYKALGNSTYNSVQEFDKLPKEVQRSVGSPDMLRSWSQLELDEIQTVIQSNFMRSFKTASKQIKEYDLLPENVKKFTLDLANKMDMKLLE